MEGDSCSITNLFYASKECLCFIYNELSYFYAFSCYFIFLLPVFRKFLEEIRV